MSYDVIQDSYSYLPEGRLILSCTLEIRVAVSGSFEMCFALLLGSLILGYYGKVAIGTLWPCRLCMTMTVIIIGV